ncbi:MAG: AraC family transcriptional regulator [Clostridia bacterium]|nr:AraC family transcriptional regulator [Clostridia bacterium]
MDVLNRFGHLENMIYIEHGISSSSKSFLRANHFHDFYELYFYLGDSMTYFIDSKAYSIEKYDIVFIDKGVFHRTNYKKGTKERILILFHPMFFSCLSDISPMAKILNQLAETPVIRLNASAIEQTKNTLFHLYNAYQNPDFGDFTHQIILANLLLYLKQYIDTTAQLPNPEILYGNRQIVPEVVAYLNQNYNRSISLEELSSKFFVDKYYLCHVFKKITGVTIITFINNKRLRESQKLLKWSDLPVAAICARTGFQSQNHFNNLFKSTFGQTPSDYRKEQKKWGVQS